VSEQLLYTKQYPCKYFSWSKRREGDLRKIVRDKNRCRGSRDIIESEFNRVCSKLRSSSEESCQHSHCLSTVLPREYFNLGQGARNRKVTEYFSGILIVSSVLCLGKPHSMHPSHKHRRHKLGTKEALQ